MSNQDLTRSWEKSKSKKHTAVEDHMCVCHNVILYKDFWLWFDVWFWEPVFYSFIVDLIPLHYKLSSLFPIFLFQKCIIALSSREKYRHCVKSVQIQSYFWSVIFCIRTRNNSLFGHFSRSANIHKITAAPSTSMINGQYLRHTFFILMVSVI